MKTTKPRGRPKKVAIPIEEKEAPIFEIAVTIAGKAFLGSGSTPIAALANLQRPPKVVSKGMVEIRYGALKKEMLYSIPQIKRLYYPLARTVIAKQFTTLLK